jgi:hypothetical protein
LTPKPDEAELIFFDVLPKKLGQAADEIFRVAACPL